MQERHSIKKIANKSDAPVTGHCRAVLLLCLLALFASKAQGQACGGSFGEFIVSDAEGKSISNVTVELIARLPDNESRKSGYGAPVKLSLRDAEELMRHGTSVSGGADFCGNPFKQLSNTTAVRKFPNDVASRKRLGFCRRETTDLTFLLRISAPGYATEYYAGNYLGGCWPLFYYIVMTKEEKGR